MPLIASLLHTFRPLVWVVPPMDLLFVMENLLFGVERHLACVAVDAFGLIWLASILIWLASILIILTSIPQRWTILIAVELTLSLRILAIMISIALIGSTTVSLAATKVLTIGLISTKVSKILSFIAVLPIKLLITFPIASVLVWMLLISVTVKLLFGLKRLFTDKTVKPFTPYIVAPWTANVLVHILRTHRWPIVFFCIIASKSSPSKLIAFPLCGCEFGKSSLHYDLLFLILLLLHPYEILSMKIVEISLDQLILYSGLIISWILLGAFHPDAVV